MTKNSFVVEVTFKANEFVVDEMFQMTSESSFSWEHRLTDLNGISMCLFNIRLWNVDLQHFLCDKI